MTLSSAINSCTSQRTGHTKQMTLTEAMVVAGAFTEIVGVTEQYITPHSVLGLTVVPKHSTSPSIWHSEARERTSLRHMQLDHSADCVRRNALEHDEDVLSSLLQLTSSVSQLSRRYVFVNVTATGVVGAERVPVKYGWQTEFQSEIMTS
jgi:hypothetical protein